jgi:hypothetical protein
MQQEGDILTGVSTPKKLLSILDDDIEIDLKNG